MRPPTTELLEGWGGSVRSEALVWRPLDPEDVPRAVLDARERGLTIAARGGGLSYGDAALNAGGAVLDVSGLARVLELDAERGLVRAGAGLTIADLWRSVLPAGWWPPVVPGSMAATLGGCVAMDVHGKNHAAAGSFGRHVEALTLVTGEGQVVRVRRKEAPSPGVPALSEVVGAQGLTGTILDVTLRLKRIHEGTLDVEAWATPTLEATLAAIERGALEADYAVAWVDCTGRSAGRGVVHVARHLPAGGPGAHLELEAQRLPSRIAGVLPRGLAWRLLRPLTNPVGMRLLNEGRYRAAALTGRRRYRQPHVAFHFLLDYVPGWKRAYGRPGLMQYQLFVPAETAAVAFSEALRLQRAADMPSYLGVVKRHVAEASAATYALDGYSLALDFPWGRGPRHARLLRLCRSFDALLAEHGGRVYAAKDAVSVGRLPARRDPAFSSDLVRRWEEGGG